MIEFTSSGLNMPNHKAFNRFYNKDFHDEKDRFYGNNFGLIDIEWDENNITNSKIALKVLDKYGNVQIQKNILVKNIQPKDHMML